jgi:Concanavalin A-like lectin/glucanases superfamily
VSYLKPARSAANKIMAEFKFFCPHCGRQILCDTSYSRTQINCPVCQQPITVPQAAPEAAPGVPPPVAVPSHTSRNILFGTVAVLVLTGLVIGGWFGYSKIKIRKLPPGLVAMWSGEGNGGDTAGGNKMELTDISFAEGKTGKAFSFNGTTSTIKIPASRSLDIGAGDGFTIMAWIKPTRVDGLHPMFQWTDSAPLIIGIGVGPNENGVLASTITDVSGGRYVNSNPDVLASGVFQHIALTYDKASGVGTWYLNGVIVGRRQLSGMVETKGDLLISRHETNPGNSTFNRLYAGLMDEIAVYNRALSASEIQAICAEQNHGEPLTLPTPSTGWFESWMR